MNISPWAVAQSGVVGLSFFLSFRWEMLHYTEEKGAFTEAVRELLKRYFKVLGRGDEFHSFRNCEI